MNAILLALALLVGPGPKDYPPASSPGAINPAVTQENLQVTVCVPHWTDTIRPPSSYTNALKAMQMMVLGLVGPLGNYEEDHRVPLSAGGHPTDPRNLWPQRWSGQYGATAKDILERRAHRDLCAGRITLAEDQAIWLGDFWKAAR